MHYIHYILTLHALHTYIHTLHYTTLQYIILQCITNTLHYITYIHFTIHYNTLPYVTLHYIRLHYIHTYTYLYIHTYIYILFIFIFIPKLGLITGLSITSCLLLLGSWLSNIISCYILAATILAFEHYFSWLSNIAPHIVFVTAPLLTSYIFAAILLAFQHNYLFFVATLSTLKHYFLLRSCCYALGFPT